MHDFNVGPFQELLLTKLDFNTGFTLISLDAEFTDPSLIADFNANVVPELQRVQALQGEVPVHVVAH